MHWDGGGKMKMWIHMLEQVGGRGSKQRTGNLRYINSTKQHIKLTENGCTWVLQWDLLIKRSVFKKIKKIWHIKWWRLDEQSKSVIKRITLSWNQEMLHFCWWKYMCCQMFEEMHSSMDTTESPYICKQMYKHGIENQPYQKDDCKLACISLQNCFA